MSILDDIERRSKGRSLTGIDEKYWEVAATDLDTLLRLARLAVEFTGDSAGTWVECASKVNAILHPAPAKGDVYWAIGEDVYKMPAKLIAKYVTLDEAKAAFAPEDPEDGRLFEAAVRGEFKKPPVAPTPAVTPWPDCPTCKGNGIDRISGFSYDPENCRPCPTCAAHESAVAAAVKAAVEETERREDYGREAINSIGSERIQKAEAEIDRLRIVLRWIAEGREDGSKSSNDMGIAARDALRGGKGGS